MKVRPINVIFQTFNKKDFHKAILKQNMFRKSFNKKNILEAILQFTLKT